HRSVEAHLVDVASRVEIGRRIGVRDVDDLVSARRDANRLCVADVLDFGLEGTVVVQYLDARVPAVSRVDVALCVDGDAVDAGELAWCGALLAPRLHEDAVLRKLGDPRVAAAVGDEDVALCVPRDVGRAVEDVLLRSGSGSSTP